MGGKHAQRKAAIALSRARQRLAGPAHHEIIHVRAALEKEDKDHSASSHGQTIVPRAYNYPRARELYPVVKVPTTGHRAWDKERKIKANRGYFITEQWAGSPVQDVQSTRTQRAQERKRKADERAA